MSARLKKKSRVPENAIIYLFACSWLFVCLFPVWIIFSATFSPDNVNMTKVFFPTDFANGISKIYTALTSVNIAKATVDTFLYTILAIIGVLITSSLASYEFTFYNFPFKKLLFAILMGSMMLPLVLYVIPLYRFVFSLGLGDTIWGVALPMMISPLYVFILNQFAEDIPSSFVEAARIDGAGHFHIYFYIFLPVIRNGLITVTVLTFLGSWGTYLWPALISGNSVMPMSRTIANLLSPYFYVDERVRMAAMLIAMIPPLLTFVIFQRYVIEGITMSGIKG
ncbi:MAG TPA: carbohydrate ABC transporter permease [Clostridiales bacterium]|nr:carbohydrate ABC transporter permease [Clostridiales bacterium]